MTQEQLRQIEGRARSERAFLCMRYDHYAMSPEIFRLVKKMETDAAWAAHERTMRKESWNARR
jgi:hypothetical protein